MRLATSRDITRTHPLSPTQAGSMKRDMDLIRQILLDIEGGKYSFQVNVIGKNQTIITDPIQVAQIKSMRYHLRILGGAGFVSFSQKDVRFSGEVLGLTWQGHDFLDTIRDPDVWRKTKEGAKKASGAGFGFVVELGKAYAKAELQKLGLPLG